MNSRFGFSTEASTGGDFLPIVKYDARSGRMFRMDRDNVGGEWVKTEVDITKTFKALMDLENSEVGWIEIANGAAPVFALAKIGEPIPAKPTPKARNGIRVVLKLAKECANDTPIREIAGNARSFMQGMEKLQEDYAAGVVENPGKLPVVILEDTVPVKSSGKDENGKPVSSTNYAPVFKITGWAPRGDLEFQPKNAPASDENRREVAGSPPSTGSTRVDPPKAKEPELADSDDFG